MTTSFQGGFAISIHALLAESDIFLVAPGYKSFRFLSTLSLRRATNVACGDRHQLRDFYPRSPCGERPFGGLQAALSGDFYPRSPCGERPQCRTLASGIYDFYPRSPCGERLPSIRYTVHRSEFLSTLSLRRATCPILTCRPRGGDFYPRSPCGERPAIGRRGRAARGNFYPRSPCGERRYPTLTSRPRAAISIHALLAESDRNYSISQSP